MIMTLRLILVATVILAANCFEQIAWGQKANKPRERVLLKNEREYLAPLDADSTPLKAGVKVTFWTLVGKKNEGEITDTVAGRAPGTLRQIGLQANGKKMRFTTDAIARFEIDGKIYEVLLDAEKKGHVLLDLARRDEVVTARLKATRQNLWQEPTEAEHTAAVEEYKTFLKEIETAYPNHGFKLHETEFFLFLTDIPANQIAGYIASLDEMYKQMCFLFAIPPERNIWRGKAVVVAFLRKADFVEAEARFMKTDSGDKYGICHSFSNGKVVTMCYRGDDPAAFAGMLVHETSHGFVHRFRSNGRTPGWVNEGIADWISSVVVVPNKQVARAQQVALERLRATGSLDGTFEATGLEFGGTGAWQYGAASGLTDFLIRRDPNLYRGFLTDMKEGHSWEESLQEIYGMTPADLAQAFGKAIGVPTLRP